MKNTRRTQWRGKLADRAQRYRALVPREYSKANRPWHLHRQSERKLLEQGYWRRFHKSFE